MIRFYRAFGSTPSERLLHQLCTETFLSLWSYANVYRDQGHAQRNEGKELCDLLVVFGDHVLIFSDKSCAFPTHQDTRVAWARWYSRAIERSARQIFGAERWLMEHPNRVFLDPRCTVPFPWALPRNPRIHRIVVATGAAQEIAASGRVRGLTIEPGIRGDVHRSGSCQPFHVGVVDPCRGFVHVLDEWSISLLTRVLDTAPDLIAYLSDKEAFIRSGALDIALDESCLLALYLSRMENESHVFPRVDSARHFVLNSDLWSAFVADGKLRRKKDSDQVSYLWDALISRFSDNLEAGALVGGSGNDPAVVERALRELAGESRVVRRQLAQAVIEVRERGRWVKEDYVLRTVVGPALSADKVFVFVALHNLGWSDDEYRDRRRKLLLACAIATKSRFTQSKTIVGIALEPQGYETSSEDIIFYAPEDWSAEQQAKAEELRRQLGLGDYVQKKRWVDYEFPQRLAKSPDDRRKERNKRKKAKELEKRRRQKRGRRSRH